MSASAVTHDAAAAFRTITSQIKAAVAAAPGTANPAVSLLAVGKTKSAEMIKEVYDLGQRHFGENYVNELVAKAGDLPSDIKWHFIGHLQSNKALRLLRVPNIHMVECVDSLKLAQKLNSACKKVGRTEKLNVLIQVNTSGEASKSGCEPADCAQLVNAVMTTCDELVIKGLMTIGQYEAAPSSTYFDILKQCKKETIELIPALDTPDFQLSMGMSHDMDLAIACGSTQVRVGAAIFGPRSYPLPVDSDSE